MRVFTRAHGGDALAIRRARGVEQVYSRNATLLKFYGARVGQHLSGN
jgi:hypothetical protein